jgi:hypothetical protein
MTLRAYAEERGINLNAVQDRIKNGSITERAFVVEGKKKFIISEIADEDFRKLANPASVMRAAASYGKDATKLLNGLPVGNATVEKPVNNDENPPVTKVPMQEDDFDRFKKAKASTEEMRAEKLELEVAEMRGRLVDIEMVKERITKLVGSTREVFLNIPGKIGPELFACEALIEVENRLRDEINAALEQLQRMNFDDISTTQNTANKEN